jgi:hypothetical protein
MAQCPLLALGARDAARQQQIEQIQKCLSAPCFFASGPACGEAQAFQNVGKTLSFKFHANPFVHYIDGNQNALGVNGTKESGRFKQR